MTAKIVDDGFPAIICLASLAFALVTAEFMPISLLTPIGQELEMSPALAGQMVTITAIAATLGGPAVLIFLKQTDRKKLLLGLIAALVVSCFVSAVANSVLILMLSRILTGIALGGFWALSGAIAIRLVPSRRAAKSLAVIAAGVSTATVLAGPVAAVIGDAFGWRTAMLSVGLISIVLFVAVWRLLPIMPVAESLTPADLAGVLRLPGVLRGLSVLFFIVVGHFSAFAFIRPFLETVTEDANWVSLRLLIFGFCGVAGNFLGGAISTRSPLLSAALSAILLSSAGIGLFLVGANGVSGAVSVGLWGVAFGAAPVSMQAYLLALAPKRLEALGAWNLVTFQLAITVGALIGAYLIEVHGPESLVLPLIMLPIVAAITIGMQKVEAL